MVIVWLPPRDDGTRDIPATSDSAQVTVARSRHAVGHIYRFDRDLEALALLDGLHQLDAATPPRSPLPKPLAAFRRDADGHLSPIHPRSLGLRLPPIDVAQVLQSGRCLDPPLFVSQSCGATVALGLQTVARPALPGIPECPTGW